MKNIFTILLIFLTSKGIWAQNNVGIGLSSPASSAMLDIFSTSKGLLIPRMTSTQRSGIPFPAKGLLVFDNTTSTFWFYNGSAWSELSETSSQFTLPYAGSFNNNGDILSITNMGTGAAISGNTSANSIAAIEGNSTASVGGNGVLGTSTSTTGAGIGGINATGTAVSGFSSGTGTALRGVSTSGYGLVSSGNLRLTGGNTNPTEGAVLISTDASGNAVWKPRKVAFHARTNNSPNIAHGVSTTMFMNVEWFDSGNDFNIQSAVSDQSSFIVPVTGVYHLDASVQIYLASTVDNLESAVMTLLVNGVGVDDDYNNVASKNFATSSIFLKLSNTYRFVAGDKVKIVLEQWNEGSLTAEQSAARFSGHLVFAE